MGEEKNNRGMTAEEVNALKFALELNQKDLEHSQKIMREYRERLEEENKMLKAENEAMKRELSDLHHAFDILEFYRGRGETYD